MSGVQGLEFGPFPQDITLIKRTTTARPAGSSGADPELVWSRNNALVAGFYRVYGRLIINNLNPVPNNVSWSWSIPDGINALVDIAVTTLNFIDSAVTPISWVGDQDARYDTAFSTAGSISANLTGTIYIPQPGNVSLNWAPTDDMAELLTNTFVQLKLVR